MAIFVANGQKEGLACGTPKTNRALLRTLPIKEVSKNTDPPTRVGVWRGIDVFCPPLAYRVRSQIYGSATQSLDLS